MQPYSVRGVSDQIVLGSACQAPPGTAAVAGGCHHTVHAAAEILAAGGNATDAAVAGMMAAAMAEPVLTSPGGGGFLMHAPLNEEPRYLDFFVNTPGLGASGSPAPMTAVPIIFGTTDDPQAEQIFHAGWSSVAVPGALAGYIEAHQRWGRLPWAQVTQPAIDLAHNGLVLDAIQRDFLRLVADVLTLTPGSAQVYQEVLRTGRFANSQYADALEQCQRNVAAAYQDWVNRVAQEVRANGGILTAEDLAAYEVVQRAPSTASRNGHRLWVNPPPSFGGAIVLDALSEIPRWDGTSWDAVAEALLMATVRQRERDAHEEATEVATGTTHITVVDRDGLMVSCTTSNGSGSGTEVGGIQLNNMLGEEDLNPGGMHAFAPGVRMGSMMTPTLIERTDGTRVAFGTGGSERIRSAIVCVALQLLDQEVSLVDAINADRLHVTDTSIELEPGVNLASATGFAHHRIRNWPQRDLFFGGVHGISRAPDGSLEAVGDLRRGGTAAVVRFS